MSGSSPVSAQVRAQRLPVIFSLRVADKFYVTKEATRAHLSGRTTFLRIAAVAPVLVTLFSLFQLLRRREEDNGATKTDFSEP